MSGAGEKGRGVSCFSVTVGGGASDGARGGGLRGPVGAIGSSSSGRGGGVGGLMSTGSVASVVLIGGAWAQFQALGGFRQVPSKDRNVPKGHMMVGRPALGGGRQRRTEDTVGICE